MKQSACIVLLIASLTGCKSLLPEDTVVGPGYQPANVYRLSPRFPDTLRRVAVMPITPAISQWDTEEGCQILQPILVGELAKTKAFEVTPISADQLRQWTGSSSWTAEDKLPPNLLKSIHEALGCQAILFSRLTNYRPYKPPIVGWNLKLVDAVDARIWWSVDEVFDAGSPPVANSARRYDKEYFESGQTLPDSQSIFNAPRRFGQYTLSAVLATMPAR